MFTAMSSMKDHRQHFAMQSCRLKKELHILFVSTKYHQETQGVESVKGQSRGNVKRGHAILACSCFIIAHTGMILQLTKI